MVFSRYIGLLAVLIAGLCGVSLAVSSRLGGADGDTCDYIMYTALAGEQRDLFLMDVSHRLWFNLTHSEVDEYFAQWSPDGGQVIYVAGIGSQAEIYTADVSSLHITQLTDNDSWDVNPSWSPDGALIVFVTDRDGNAEIYRMNADGTEPINLTHRTTIDTSPSWSPDGRLITFVSDDRLAPLIFTVPREGGRSVPISNGFEYGPVWLPDGTGILYHSFVNANVELFVRFLDGRPQSRLTDNDALDHMPMWSADGARLLLTSERDGNFEIYSMEIDGTSVINLTQNLASDIGAVWSADMRSIAFLSDRIGDHLQLYRMSPDGSNVRRLSDQPLWNVPPVWRPCGVG